LFSHCLHINIPHGLGGWRESTVAATTAAGSSIAGQLHAKQS